VMLECMYSRLGDVPIADVANLMLGVQAAAATAAVRLLGRRPAAGRRSKLIEKASRLRLVRPEEGSVGVLVRVPKATGEDEGEDTVPLVTVEGQSLGARAVAEVVRALISDHPDPATARTLVQMPRGVGLGARYESIPFVEQPETGRSASSASILLGGINFAST
jgi:hypothetical protein